MSLRALAPLRLNKLLDHLHPALARGLPFNINGIVINTGIYMAAIPIILIV